jgi:hypothetical protein
MITRSRSLATVLVTAATAGALVTTCAVVGAGLASAARASAAEPAAGSATAAICTSTLARKHKFAAWLSHGISRALAGRHSTVGLTVSDPRLGLSCALDETSHFDAASAIKATIISALLLKKGGPSHLTSREKSLAWLMITESDNDAATALWNDVGMAGMQRFLDRAAMKHTELAYAWGLTLLTAQDELTLLRVLAYPGHVLSTASRRYALDLMAHVEPSQRWGVPDGAPAGVTVSVKNGWLPYPTGSDWHINSIGVFSGHNIAYQIAILTSGNPGEAYGIATVDAAARVINRDIARG